LGLPSLTIVGLVRNGGPDLPASLAAAAAICDASEQACCIIVTNDNTDDTDRNLAEWASTRTNAKIIRCDGIAKLYPDRIDRIAHLRNVALSEARRRSPQPELLVVMDLDGLNVHVSPQDIARSVAGAPRDWAGLFANQDGPYYDLYALRKPGWVSDRFWRAVTATPKARGLKGVLIRLTQRHWRKRIRGMVRARQYAVPADAGFIPVESAFGGLGIYRFRALDGLAYGSRNEKGERVCEHVVLNRFIAARGGGLYIDAGLRNRCPEDHFGRDKALSGLPFPAKLRT
jgi:hypothetical protein